MHDDCIHGPGVAWSAESFLRFFSRCDTCNKFRLWARYFEVYGKMSDWWWECDVCIEDTVAYAED